MIQETRSAARHWRAQMIGPDCDDGQGTRGSFVARDFDLATVAGDEALHITAHGLYVAYLNGRRVGQDLLTPGWTVYDDRIAFQTYPVADLLQSGRNRLEIWLSDGWWRGRLMWDLNPIVDCWGSDIGALAEITSGERLILGTGPDWSSGLLPITRAGIYWGESYDAREEVLSDSHGVSPRTCDLTRLVPHEVAGVGELPPLDPIETWTDTEGRQILDFGQNCAAIPRLTVTGAAGAKVLVEFSEQLGKGRTWDNRNYRGARAAADYTLRGGAPETWSPRFTFMGYRYARVTIEGEARLDALLSVPITSVPDRRASFTSGHPLVNRLVENTVWSQRSNFIEVPTDCPQRDERLGWTGDAQVFAGTALWLAHSGDMLRKFLRDVMADQRENGAIPHFSPDPTRRKPIAGRGDWAGATGWGDAITIIPWQLYLHEGDTETLRDCFPAMIKWLDYLWGISNGPIILPPSEWGAHGFTFGDWLQPVGDNRKPRPTIGDDCAATLYHYISTSLTARIATILGDREQADWLAARADQIKAAFQHEFITPSGRLAHNDQTSYAIAFLHDLIPEAQKPAARAQFRRIVEDANYLIGTGFIGTPDLLPALTQQGMHDLAAKVFLNEEVPGWLYQVRQGATTIWERWDALGPDGTIYDPDMNSYNHYAYGAVVQWLFEGVAGLRRDPARPGFAGLLLDPVIIPELSPVAARHDSPKGLVSAEWALDGTRVTYVVTLPPGCEASFDGTTRQGLTLNGTTASGRLALPPGRHEIGFDL